MPTLKFKLKNSYSIEDIMKYKSILDLSRQETIGCSSEVSVYYNLRRSDCRRFFTKYLVSYYDSKAHLYHLAANGHKFERGIMVYFDENISEIDFSREKVEERLIEIKETLKRTLR